MLQSIRLKRVRHNLVAEQQQHHYLYLSFFKHHNALKSFQEPCLCLGISLSEAGSSRTKKVKSHYEHHIAVPLCDPGISLESHKCVYVAGKSGAVD